MHYLQDPAVYPYYSGHGSFDSFLLEGGSFPFRMYRQIRMLIFDICCLMLCKKYILNSIGEGEKLAQYKFDYP